MHRRLAAALVVTLAGAIITAAAQPPEALDTAARAQHLMRDAMEVVRRARDRSAAGPPDAARATAVARLNPARAALIGTEITPLMTTLGSLESKRLATDPRWAGALAGQLSARGIDGGATVLASFSGSFPGLNLAVMAACRALGVRLFAISSVTASTWGANEPGFTWPEMEAMVVAAGVLPRASVAIALGGTRDAARGLSDEGRAIARRIQRDTAASLGATVLETTTLEEAIGRRLETSRAALAGNGGNGVSPRGLRECGRQPREPGRRERDVSARGGWLAPSPSGRAGAMPASVTDAWLAEGVPVLNMLDVKALAKAWGVQR